jgi:hypothetical protein
MVRCSAFAARSSAARKSRSTGTEIWSRRCSCVAMGSLNSSRYDAERGVATHVAEGSGNFQPAIFSGLAKSGPDVQRRNRSERGDRTFPPGRLRSKNRRRADYASSRACGRARRFSKHLVRGSPSGRTKLRRAECCTGRSSADRSWVDMG